MDFQRGEARSNSQHMSRNRVERIYVEFFIDNITLGYGEMTLLGGYDDFQVPF
jgi:hypothetical protein